MTAMKGLFRKSWVAAGAAIALTAAAPGAASAARGADAMGPGCPTYPLSQPFLAWGDANQYALLPGESVDNVDGAGWQLFRGASLLTTQLQDGQEGQVLDMPAGSVAVTPPMCVNASDYPLARTMLADVTGSEGVAVYVSYQAGGSWGWPFAAGMVKNAVSGWYPSKPIMLHSAELQGNHMMRLVLVACAGEYRLYNFYVDPRRGH